MRVYVPLTLPVLKDAYESGELAPDAEGVRAAAAVTPELREWCATDDAEELEYAALGQAALASLRLLAADPAAPRRRVVLAAEVADGSVAPAPAGAVEPAPGEVRLSGPVPLGKVAAVHADAGDAEPDVAAAANALAAAGSAGEAASPAVEAADDHELLWYATQEIPYVTDRP